MKKETVVAIVLGIALGVVVAVVFVLKNHQAQIQKSKPITATLQVTPSPPPTATIEALELEQPQSGSIVNSSSVTIKGKVAKDSLVIIQSPIKTVVLKNTPENLETSFPLAFGENNIHIVVYPKDSQVSTKEKELQIYYLDEK